MLDLGYEDGRRPTVADLPGLIEGASLGAGLGFAFLRHAARTRVLVHVVDASAADPFRDAETIRGELRAHNEALLGKTTLVHQTDFGREESAERFQHELLRQGIEAALRRAGCRTGDSVRIGDLQMDWEDLDEGELLDAAEAAEALEIDLVPRGESEG